MCAKKFTTEVYFLSEIYKFETLNRVWEVIFAKRYHTMENTVLSKLKWRYATKKFDPNKKLTQEQVGILKESFNLTATSYGLQPLKMLVISNPEIKEQLVPISMNQAQVKDASHVLVLCIEDGIEEQYIVDHFNRVEAVRNTSRDILDPYQEMLIDSFSKKKVAVDVI